jgi:hypothetical protein
VAISDHATVGTVFGSMERAFSLRAAEHEEAAERARDDKKRQLGKHVNIPPEHRKRLEMAHDATIRHHEEQGQRFRRRAAYLASGYALDSPSERRDADFVRQHHDLLDLARKTGRLRYSDEASLHPAGGADAESLRSAAEGVNETVHFTEALVTPQRYPEGAQ